MGLRRGNGCAIGTGKSGIDPSEDAVEAAGEVKGLDEPVVYVGDKKSSS